MYIIFTLYKSLILICNLLLQGETKGTLRFYGNKKFLIKMTELKNLDLNWVSSSILENMALNAFCALLIIPDECKRLFKLRLYF